MTDTNSPEIAMLLGDTGRDYDIADELMRAGFDVYVCASTQEVRALVRVGKRPVLLADARQVSALDDLPIPCLAYTPGTAKNGMPGAGASMGRGAAGTEIRLAGPGTQAELAVIVRIMRRHLDGPPPPRRTVESLRPAPAQWRLVTPPRRLVSPEGHAVPLTLTEWQFVSLLFMAPNQVLSFAHWEAAAVRAGVRKTHNVAVLVSRLRRKATHRGIKLPLQAVRGVGYAFTDPCGRLDARPRRAP